MPLVVDERVKTETPEELVDATVPSVFPVPPETEKLRAWPTIGLSKASRIVAVSEVVVEPSATIPVEGDARRVLRAKLGLAATKDTDPETPVRLVSETVFDSAFVLLIVVVATPLVFVVSVVPPRVFALPEAPSVTAVFVIRFP